MSDAAFLARLAQAVQTQHESTMKLQELASELQDHCQRMRSFTDRLHIMRAELAPPSDEPLVLPRVLQGGPQRVGER
jgi:2-polyprenyl-6-methoxyphenol hydroxylase-like FAD-dependent oxidoreductase